MALIIAITIIAWTLCNLLPIYLFFTYGKKKEMRKLFTLFTIAPNQYVYMILFLPIAIFFTLQCGYIMVNQIGPELSDWYSPLIRNTFYENWALVVVAAAILSILVSVAIYLTSGFSIDKLKPEYIDRAVDIILRSSKTDEVVTIPDDLMLVELDALTDNEYIYVVSSRVHQRKLKLLNPPVYLLSAAQMFVAVTFAAVIAICAFLACHLIHYQGIDSNASISRVIDLITIVAISFSFFPIFYNMYRRRIFELTNVNTTASQDVVSLIVISLIIIAIRLILPENRGDVQSILINTVPAVFTVGCYGIISFKFHSILEELFGIKSHAGTYALMSIVIILATLFCSALIGFIE